MKKLILFSLSLFTVLFLSGCLGSSLKLHAPRSYTSAKHNIPVFNKANQVQLMGSINETYIDHKSSGSLIPQWDSSKTKVMQFAYSITENIAVCGGHQSMYQSIYRKESNSFKIKWGDNGWSGWDSTFHSKSKTKSDYYEMSIAYFKQDSIFYNAILVGYGFADQRHNNHYILTATDLDDGIYTPILNQTNIFSTDLDYSVFYVEPILGFMWDYFEILISTRIVLVNYHNINREELNIKESDIIINSYKKRLLDLDNSIIHSFEPAITMNIGFENIKISFQIESASNSYSTDYSSDYFSEETSYPDIYIGLLVRF